MKGAGAEARASLADLHRGRKEGTSLSMQIRTSEKHDLWVFSFAQQTDRVTLSGGTQLGPVPGTIYSQATWLQTGWSITSGPSGIQIPTMNRYLYL
jgi:hypothetical protein